MTKPPRSKHAYLLADPETRRWHDALDCNSPSTAQGYLANLGLFLERNQTTPAAFLALAPRQRDNLMADHITALHRAGKSKSAMKSSKAAVASWLDHHGERFQRRFRFPRALAPTDASQFTIPSQDRFRNALDASDTRERVAEVLVGQAGLRPAILGNKKATAGLQFKHLPEARLTPEGIVFERVPTMVQVPAHLNKVRHAFFTFLGPEGCEYLAALVRERLNAGEALTPESAVVPPTREDYAGRFLQSGTVSQIIRGPLRRAGIEEPPYILRSYFGNRCLMAQVKGLLHDYKEFFMGHAGSISAVYALNKGQLPPDTVEAMREAYTQALEFLETRQTSARKDPWPDMIRALLGVAGVPEEAVKGLDFATMDSEAVINLVRQHRATEEPTAGLARVAQRIIAPTELEAALGRGWRVAFQLGDGRFVMEGE